MNSSLILSITTFVYGTAALLYIIAWIFQHRVVGRIAFLVTIVGFLGNLAGFGLRWAESYQLGFGRAPLSNLYESLVFFALSIAALYLLVERRKGNQTMGAFVLPMTFLCMAYASLSPNISDRIQPLLPALKSNWLIAHVVTCFIGYAAFAIAFCLSLMLLAKKETRDDRESIWTKIPDRRSLDDLTHKMVMLGFLFLTLGIITGAVWANSAWGRYWGLGSQRDLVTHHLVYLCHVPSCPFNARMAGEKDGRALHRRVWSRTIHLFRRQSAARPAQLWKYVS
jgi:cytochrome c-type biogenesis protein CcsB